MEIILKPKGKIGITIEAEVIRPDAMYQKKKEEIENLTVWQGPEQMPLGDFFDVEVTGNGPLEETSIIIQGEVSRVKRIGQGMKTGKIEIQGSAGMHAGSGMTGGNILVHGDVGSWAGMEMKGGLLRVLGNAGDHIGSAYRGSWSGMTGGKIIIDGNARNQLGSGLTGGEISVAGNVENFTGIHQSGGLTLVRGDAIRGASAEMTGGTLAVCGRIKQFSPGFTEVGHEENPKLGENQLEGKFVKFSGDYAFSKNPKGSLYAKEV